MEYFVNPPSYVDVTKNYNVYTISTTRENNVQYSHTAYNSNSTILLVENTATLGTGLATLVTSLNAVLDVWLDSAATEYVEKAGGSNIFA